MKMTFTEERHVAVEPQGKTVPLPRNTEPQDAEDRLPTIEDGVEGVID